MKMDARLRLGWPLPAALIDCIGKREQNAAQPGVKPRTRCLPCADVGSFAYAVPACRHERLFVDRLARMSLRIFQRGQPLLLVELPDEVIHVAVSAKLGGFRDACALP